MTRTSGRSPQRTRASRPAGVASPHLFRRCRSVLAAANAVGKVGPNLDVIQPSYGLTLRTIQNGCLQNPPKGSQEACLGYGTMPADVVQGTDAQNVAKFVSKVAGKE